MTETEAEMMASCEKMIVSVATRYHKPGMGVVTLEDLIHEARLSLWNSVQRWLKRDEKTKTMKFSTHAYGWMRHDLYEYVLNFREVIRVPRQHNYARQVLLRVPCVSLDDLSFEDGEKTLHEVVADAGDEVPLYEPREVQCVITALETLSEQDQWVLRQRFFNERTLRSIGEDRGMTREAVRQRMNKALKRLKHRVENLERKGMN